MSFEQYVCSSKSNFALAFVVVFVLAYNYPEGYFPLGGIFRPERHFLLFKYQFTESGRQKTKENVIPRAKFSLVENDPIGVDKIGNCTDTSY